MYLYRPGYTDPKTRERRKQRTYWVEYYVGGRRFRESTGTRAGTGPGESSTGSQR